jgi:hypothetical protein
MEIFQGNHGSPAPSWRVTRFFSGGRWVTWPLIMGHLGFQDLGKIQPYRLARVTCPLWRVTRFVSVCRRVTKPPMASHQAIVRGSFPVEKKKKTSWPALLREPVQGPMPLFSCFRIGPHEKNHQNLRPFAPRASRLVPHGLAPRRSHFSSA